MNDVAKNGEQPTPIDLFREKVAERIRGDIGDLMPDEMLQQIVKDTIDKEMNRPIGTSFSSTPWIQKKISETIGEQLKAMVAQELAAKEAEVKAAVLAAVKEAVPAALTSIIVSMLNGQINDLEFKITNALNQRGY